MMDYSKVMGIII